MALVWCRGPTYRQAAEPLHVQPHTVAAWPHTGVGRLHGQLARVPSGSR